MYIGIVYTYLPFMVLPLYARLSRLDPTLLEAAGDLGAPPWRAFLAVTLPLSLPGVWAGALLVFVPAVGEYVIPELLGGPQAQLIGRVLWDEFFANRDWPTASALACMLLVLLLLVPAGVFRIWLFGKAACARSERPAGPAGNNLLAPCVMAGLGAEATSPPFDRARMAGSGPAMTEGGPRRVVQ